jgi:alpha-tubulin suppressor-like RCC1 family protein
MKRALVLGLLAPLPVVLALGPLASCSNTPVVVKEAAPDTRPCYTCFDASPQDVLTCDGSLVACKGQCIDVNGNDPMNCGMCGKVCANNVMCQMGRCLDEPGDIAAGGNFSVVALLDGTLEAWGGDEAGQIGDDPNGFTSQCPNAICRFQPVAIQGPTNVKKVAAGWDHACAVQGDGKLFCWGSNAEGQLGHDPATDKSCNVGLDGGVLDGGIPFKCNWTPTEVTLPAKVVDVAAGKGFTCARTDTKDVYCWGTKTNAVTGRTGVGFDFNPNKLGGFASDVEEISVAGTTQPTHGCGRRTDGTIMCWGKNDYGQLGQAMPAVSATPIAVQNITQAVRIVTGENTSCAYRQDGTSKCWGSHARGGLGNATPIDTMPHPVPGDTKMKWGVTMGLYGGVATFFVKDSADQWWRWGVNVYGTYGDGTKTAAMCGNDVCDPNTAQDNALYGYRYVSVSNHVLGVSKGGKLFAWGRNDVGQLGKAPGGTDEMCPGNVYCNPNPQIVSGL